MVSSGTLAIIKYDCFFDHKTVTFNEYNKMSVKTGDDFGDNLASVRSIKSGSSDGRISLALDNDV